YQYAKAGAKVLAVLDSPPLSAQCRALPALLRQPATLAKGMYYRAWLTAHGIAVHQGATLTQTDCDQRVPRIRFREQTRP
ncbi:FAD/NAD(P)-binding oxidoreductase, partial [Pseudomonas fluorescens]